MLIIPAIDIIDGKCVRLEQGDYSKSKQYHSDPLEVARTFESAGIKKLHLVDLDGAKSGRVVNLKVLEAISGNTRLEIDFGGGIKSDEDIRKVFDGGAHQVTIGSMAVRDPSLTRRWMDRYGPGKIILGADVLKGVIMISGWQHGSGKQLEEFLSDYLHAGIQYVLCTDIERDGMLTGPPLRLYEKILRKFPNISLIASGGVSSTEDLTELAKLKVYGVVVGKAIYENTITLEDIKGFTDAY